MSSFLLDDVPFHQAIKNSLCSVSSVDFLFCHFALRVLRRKSEDQGVRQRHPRQRVSFSVTTCRQTLAQFPFRRRSKECLPENFRNLLSRFNRGCRRRIARFRRDVREFRRGVDSGLPLKNVTSAHGSNSAIPRQGAPSRRIGTCRYYSMGMKKVSGAVAG